MANYIDRFFQECEAPKDVNFELTLGDVVNIDGSFYIITGHGIYENQYWTERLYQDGVHLGAGNYRVATGENLIDNVDLVQKVRRAYRDAITENYHEFFQGKVYKSFLTRHLQSVKA